MFFTEMKTLRSLQSFRWFSRLLGSAFITLQWYRP